MSVCWRTSGTERKSDRNHVNFLCRCTAWRNSLLPYFKIPRRAEKWAESQIMCLPLLLFGMETEEHAWQRLATGATSLRAKCSLISWHLLPVCSKSLSSALHPLRQESDATEYKGLRELTEVLGEIQRTRYTEAGTYLYQLAVCRVDYQRQWVCAPLRTRFFGIFWTINKRVVTRAVVCTAAALSSLLPLRKDAKRDNQPWTCLSVRLHGRILHPL